MNPKISIIVPVYNAERYLHQCIDSILVQTHTDFELLLINDGSTDNSGSICNEYSQKDSRINVFHKENGGVSSARNFGITKSEGEYICFIDSDDWIESTFIEKLLLPLITQNADVIFCDYYKEYYNKTREVKSSSDFYNMKVLGMVWGKIYKKKSLFFDEDLKLSEDVHYNFRYAKDTLGLLKVDLTLYHYRILDSSAVRTYSKDTVSKYNSSIMKIKLIVDKKREIDALDDFICIVYLVICMNYIMTHNNNTNFLKKIQLIKQLSELKLYKAALAKRGFKNFEITRKIPLYFASINFWLGVGIIAALRNFQTSIRNYKK